MVWVILCAVFGGLVGSIFTPNFLFSWERVLEPGHTRLRVIAGAIGALIAAAAGWTFAMGSIQLEGPGPWGLRELLAILFLCALVSVTFALLLVEFALLLLKWRKPSRDD